MVAQSLRAVACHVPTSFAPVESTCKVFCYNGQCRVELPYVHRDCKARFVFVLNVIFSKAPRLGLVMAWATSLDPFHPDRPWSELSPHERCLQE